ncbi:MAG: ribosome small subunit-dependent GTPase A [Elusimicrobia bacterium]|nr:ribosome small subunit-dependent GTPase A [Elusimicrobiota bacterium]
MDLESLGWDARFASSFRELDRGGWVPGRVVEKHRRSYSVLTEAGPCFGLCRRSFLDRHGPPALGDWVAARRLPGETKAVIEAVLPARNRFARKKAGLETGEQVVAANVDVAFLVAALGLDFNPRRLERYLALACEAGATPVILLNKADLHPEHAVERREAAALLEGVRVHAVSAATGLGLDGLREHLSAGRTAAFLGSSGAGKSSLINRLLGAESQRVAAVRAGDERGRHTTASGRLILLPGGGVLVDTAGMRELGLWEGDSGVEQVFREIEEAAGRCRFRDCAHAVEPGCGVTAALAAGEIAPERLESWRKLGLELAHLAEKQDKRLEAEREKRWKKLIRLGQQRSREKRGGS